MPSSQRFLTPVPDFYRASGKEDRCLHVALPVAAFLEMLTKSVNLRATAATRTGCFRHGVGHQTPLSGSGSRNAAEDLRPNILQLNTEGLTADKISVIEHLAYKNKAFIIFLQETHCTTADKLVIPNFSQAGSILSRPCHVCPRAVWMVTGRSVSRTIRDWVVVRRCRRIQDCQRLQTSTLATHS